jgi:hypothetical protein
MSTCVLPPASASHFSSVSEELVFQDLLQRDTRVRVIWCRFSYVQAEWIRVTGVVRQGPGKAATVTMPIGEFLAARLQQFIVEANGAAEDGKALDLAALKTRALADAEGLFDQLSSGLRDFTIASALIIDYLRAVELITHLMLEARPADPVRISTAGGGLTLRSNRTPYTELLANRRPLSRFKEDRASQAIGSDVIAALYRTHGQAIEGELNKAIEELRFHLEEEGMEMRDFEGLLAAA